MRKVPYDFQNLAIENVIKGFKEFERGQLIMPCGTGKTLISLWIYEQLKPHYTLVVFPSLALLRQTKNEWVDNSKHPISYLCVCSEKDINSDIDSVRLDLSEIDNNVTTDPAAIKQFLLQNKNVVIFSTYQSINSIALAVQRTKIIFDLVLADEAHKTAGVKKSVFSEIHDNTAIPAHKRLYMTATPRIISQYVKAQLNRNEKPFIVDMNDPKIFGPVFHYMSFKEAIDQGILVDYKIVVIGINDSEIQKIIKEKKLTRSGVLIEEIADNFALDRFMSRYGANSVITFHSTVKKAEAFKERHVDFFNNVKTFHVNGKQTTKVRHKILQEFAGLSRSIVSNARCLTEGVDIPAVDAVFFCDPKNSRIDIVQAAGRALRRADHRDKSIGYVVIPLFHKYGDNLAYIVEAGTYANLINVIRSLSNHDERIIDMVAHIKNDTQDSHYTNLKNKEVEKHNHFVEFDNFADAIQEHLFDQIIDNIKLPWSTFESARMFVQGLGLKSNFEWKSYVKSGSKPEDIPAYPNEVYDNKGWISWGDWLGTGTIAPSKKQYRTFDEARKFAQKLKLYSIAEWKSYVKSGSKPEDIPAYPNEVYDNKGWISWGDWLGTGTIALSKKQYRAFDEAREFAKELKLNSIEEWKAYAKNGNKPEDIPTSPVCVYGDKGWISWGDWLGTGTVAPSKRQYRIFDEARKFVRELKLNSRAEWDAYTQNGNKPEDIPARPEYLYKHKGWISVGDWLGTGTIALSKKQYRAFDEARKFVRELKLNSTAEWYAYAKNGNKPEDIPSNPYQVYKHKGWISMGDWLGTGTIANHKKQYRRFDEARKFARALKLNSKTEWVAYSKNGNKPLNIPADPSQVYKNKGWISWGDWLGKIKS